MSDFGRVFFSLLLVWFVSIGTLARADQVTLKLKDGSFSVSGILTKFDSEFFTLDSEIGTLTLATGSISCEGAGCPSKEDLVPKFDLVVVPELGDRLVPSLIENFASSRGYRLKAKASDNQSVLIELSSPGANGLVSKIELRLANSPKAFDSLGESNADFAVLRRAPTKAEKQAMSDAGSGLLMSNVIGWETLRLYTEMSAAIDALTVPQLLAVQSSFNVSQTGTVETDFGLQGDTDSLIALHQTLGRNVESTLQERTRGGPQDPIVVTPNLSLAAPWKHIPVSANCGDPVQRADDTFGAHPLEAPLYLFYSNPRLPKIAREFKNYVLSVPAQRIVARAGYLSRTPVEARMDTDQGILLNAVLNSGSDTGLTDLRRAVRKLSGFGRLSLTFRYKEGTRDLDDVSKSNLGYLADLLQEGRYQGRDVLFAGFSDSSGNADANLALSKARADTLRDTILGIMGENAPNRKQFQSIGFGEVLPLACNDIEWGQHKNRRVEIWIR